jgi:2-dehydropantoate 2-reductase
MRDVTRVLSETGAVISMQNGLCEELIARAAGPVRTVGAMVNVGAYRTEPGAVLIGNPGRIVVGEIDGRTSPRVEGFAAMLRQLDPAAAATGNVRGFLWGKLAYSVLIKASALDDAAVSAFLSDPRRLALQRALVREVLAVAAAEGIAVEALDGFEPAAFAAADATATRRSLDRMAGFFSQSAKPQSTIWQDLKVLRRKTDAAAQLEPMFDIARRHGLGVPLCRHLIDQITAIETGTATTGPQLLDSLDHKRTQRS